MGGLLVVYGKLLRGMTEILNNYAFEYALSNKNIAASLPVIPEAGTNLVIFKQNTLYINLVLSSPLNFSAILYIIMYPVNHFRDI